MKRSHDHHKFSEHVNNHTLVFYELSDVVLHHMSQIMTADDNNLLITPRVSSTGWWIHWSGIFLAYFLAYGYDVIFILQIPNFWFSHSIFQDNFSSVVALHHITDHYVV